MKRLKFLETKRTPRYSLRKFSVGVASVLLGVTIFGINLTDHSVKAATKENVGNFNISANSNSQRTSAAVLTTAGQTNPQEATSTTGKVQQTNPQEATSTTGKVQQSSPSNNAPANNSTEAAPTSPSAPKTQSSVNSSAAELAVTNLVAMPGTNTGTDTGTDNGTGTGTDGNPAATVNPDNINTQPAKENQKLANEHNLTSSDNYSSNIYKGKDGKYYKIVTIYGNDYV